jgi:8-oxo-dGTP diphosphatase
VSVVRAAGGAVWRPAGGEAGDPDGGGDDIEVLLVHRPKYDDWSLPKGKAEPGEDDLTCALREVREETGLECEPGEELGSVSYTDRYGRPKVVRYWAMRPVRGSFEPNREVDEVRWVRRADAGNSLTYEHDAEIITRLGPESP